MEERVRSLGCVVLERDSKRTTLSILSQNGHALILRDNDQAQLEWLLGAFEDRLHTDSHFLNLLNNGSPSLIFVFVSIIVALDTLASLD